MKLTLTLRDLFWLVLVCALAMGWWLSYREAQQAKADAKMVNEMCDTLRTRLEYVEQTQARDAATDYSGVLVEIIPDKPQDK